MRDALALLDSSGLQSASFRGSQEIQQNTPRLFNAEITETEPKKNSASEKEKQSSHHEIISVGDLRNPSLIQYLKDRSIDLDISAEYLQEICFKQHGKDRQYFAIAWKNGEGFDVRNKYFKGFVGTGKTISTIEGTEPESWLIFE